MRCSSHASSWLSKWNEADRPEPDPCLSMAAASCCVAFDAISAKPGM